MGKLILRCSTSDLEECLSLRTVPFVVFRIAPVDYGAWPYLIFLNGVPKGIRTPVTAVKGARRVSDGKLR